LRDQHDYLRLLGARIAGTAGQQMLMVALGWQVYDLTASAWALGLVGLAQFVPALLFTLPAGHLVDRHDRRVMLIAAMALQALVALTLAWGSAQGWVNASWILATSVLLGIARALQMPAVQALTPSLVPAELLPRAVAASSSAMQGAIVLGPALGGALYGWLPHALGHVFPAMPTMALGAAGVYGASLALLALAIACVGLIRHRSRYERTASASWQSVTAGLRFIWQRPVLLGAISLDLFAVLLGGAVALLPIYARDILHAGPEGLGLLRAAPAAGAVVVGVALARRGIQRHAGVWLLGAVAVFGAATIGFGLARSLPLAFVLLAVSGAADMFSVVIRQSLVQLDTPEDMRGRVGAVNSVFIGASNQLGEFESGAVAALIGPVGSVLFGGIGTILIVLLWWRLFPALVKRDRLRA
jgi:MFS family permease